MTLIQRTALAVFLAMLVVFGIYKWGYGRGWGDRDAEMQAAIATANEESRAKEQKLTEQINISAVQLTEANNAISKKQSDLNAAIRAGRVRLPAASCVQASPSAPVAAGDSNQARSQPDPAPDADLGPSESERQTLQLIAQIAADGDKAINQLNACIDAYDNMRNIINGQR